MENINEISNPVFGVVWIDTKVLVDVLKQQAYFDD
jgi:hypothetical protein